jgi:hypothetical protein
MNERSASQIAWRAIAEDTPVFSSEGEEAGRVTRVVGDTEADIWDGLAISVQTLGADRLLPAERVRGIWSDRIEVALSRDQIEQLPPFEETPMVTWEADEEGDVGSLVRRFLRPGDPLEIGPSIVRAVVWAAVWGLVAALVAGLALDAGGARSTWVGLLFFELVLVSPRLWPWLGDVIVGIVAGIAGLVIFLAAGHSVGRSVLAGLLLAAGAPLMGSVLRWVAARRPRA